MPTIDCAAKLKLKLVGLYFLNSLLSCTLFLAAYSISTFLRQSQRFRFHSASQALLYSGLLLCRLFIEREYCASSLPCNVWPFFFCYVSGQYFSGGGWNFSLLSQFSQADSDCLLLQLLCGLISCQLWGLASRLAQQGLGSNLMQFLPQLLLSAQQGWYVSGFVSYCCRGDSLFCEILLLASVQFRAMRSCRVSNCLSAIYLLFSQQVLSLCSRISKDWLYLRASSSCALSLFLIDWLMRVPLAAPSMSIVSKLRMQVLSRAMRFSKGQRSGDSRTPLDAISEWLKWLVKCFLPLYTKQSWPVGISEGKPLGLRFNQAQSGRKSCLQKGLAL